jgi:hypothetical protein
VALVRTDVSEEPGASFIRVTKIGALGTTQAATSNLKSYIKFLFSTNLKYNYTDGLVTRMHTEIEI